VDPRRLSIRPLLAYYLGGTPLFFVLDAAWDVSIRASFLDGLSTRVAYYGFCLLCGVLAWRFPRREAWIGLSESAVNIILLVVGFMAPILSVTGELAADPSAAIEPPVAAAGVLNFIIAGTVAWWSFQRRVLPG
jgi:hypothetical protein